MPQKRKKVNASMGKMPKTEKHYVDIKEINWYHV
jgi:hypothetical protein